MFDQLFGVAGGRGSATTAQTVLVVEECINCGVTFAMPQTLQQERKKNGKGFYCPNGHSMVYGDGEIERLKKQLKAKEQDHLKALRRIEIEETKVRDTERERDRIARSLTATKGVTTRLKNQIAAGECPVCGKNFATLHKHMAKEHPGFVDSEEATS